jgi:hypothetical protein
MLRLYIWESTGAGTSDSVTATPGGPDPRVAMIENEINNWVKRYDKLKRKYSRLEKMRAMDSSTLRARFEAEKELLKKTNRMETSQLQKIIAEKANVVQSMEEKLR